MLIFGGGAVVNKSDMDSIWIKFMKSNSTAYILRDFFLPVANGSFYGKEK